jgi:hypothetical protein
MRLLTKHRHWWIVLGATTACCVASAAVVLRDGGNLACNSAVVVPFGLACVVQLELVAYAVWCAVRVISRLAGRRRPPR